MKHWINGEIALTHILTRKRQILIAALGVTVGMSIFIFMNSLMRGFDRYSEESLFKTAPHLRLYREDQLSKPLVKTDTTKELAIIVNPKIAVASKKLDNPRAVMDLLKRQPEVTALTPNVAANVFYTNGRSQLNGIANGTNILENNAMFNLQSSLVDGDINNLLANQDGIIIGSGIAERLNINMNDRMTVVSSQGVTKLLKVVGIFKTGNTGTDKSKSYVNVATAQQLLKENASYVTDIFINVQDPYQAGRYAPVVEQLTGYKCEDWATANASAMVANRMRRIMALAISSSILLVAGFGIYNILNMTIMQKMNDIAILKAMGFSGKDVVRIFLLQAFLIGCVGVMLGLGMATILINLLSRVWIGGDLGYFPIRFEFDYFLLGSAFGMVVTVLAGFIPARKAAKVDPVAIFRK